MNALSDFIDKEQFSKQIPISDQISLNIVGENKL